MTTETDTTYNGWKNYETWSVALIADNDEGLYNERRELIQEMINHPEDVRVSMADSVKEWVMGWYEVEQLDESEGNYLIKQLFHAAMSEVNWYEITENWIQEVKDEA